MAITTGNRGFKVTGIMQLVIAIPVLLFEILFTIGIYDDSNGGHCNLSTGAGFWSFPFYLTAGILGTILGKRVRPSRCLVSSYMAFSILSSVLASLALAFSIVAAANDWTCWNYSSYNYKYEDYTNSLLVIIPILILSVLHLIEFVVAIVGSTYCCRHFGCNCACCEDQPLGQPLLPTHLPHSTNTVGQLPQVFSTYHDPALNQHLQQQLAYHIQPHYQPSYQAANERTRSDPPNYQQEEAAAEVTKAKI